ncbi:ankyrin repeat protein [Paenibacillus endophyticus]|uniref:Ankyrin repeat protein n=1 Tax=Paenibacillus endophyticus TaxID=1294268 RepID=A0A7W5C7J5_9BACL|nr:ankyrin repeat domain-containing protein [Paenibacillus endophyticus]MBB3152174.1 ankyrin repeat protein [Paenibacillus endophyticus]
MINDVFAAASKGDTERLQELLKLEPTWANTENADGLTPLGFASHYGHAAAVQLLLDYGAELDAVSHSKVSYIPSNTALHASIAGERELAVIELLLSRGAKTNIADSNGHTSLHSAAFHDDGAAIIRLLLEHGADIHAQAEDGTTALSVAIEKGNLKAAAYLAENGATA